MVPVTDQLRNQLARQLLPNKFAQSDTDRQQRSVSVGSGPKGNQVFFSEWPAQEPRDFPRTKPQNSASRDRGRNSANRGGHRGMAGGQSRPMLLSLPNSPPQVARRKVEPRVKTRRPSEPGRNRWEEETSNTLAGPPGIRLPERRPVHPSAQPQGLQIRPCDPSPSPSVRVDEPAQKLITRPTAVDSFPEKAQTEEKVHGVLAAHVHPCNQPFLRNEEWRKQPDVTVRFGPKLSPSISVKDIFLRIRDFGTVEMIDLLIDDDGRKIGKALVRFSNVRTPFWEAGWINFGSGTVGMKLERYKGASTVPSPSNPSKLYP